MALVLIADDERMIRDNLKALLTGEGHVVVAAKDGEEAIEKCGSCHPDLLLLDVMMPKLNGYKVCERIRQLDKRLPIIFLTAKDGEVDEIRGLSVGADDYVPKDAGESLLLARIDSVLRRAGLRDAAKEVSITTLHIDDIKIKFDDAAVIDGEGNSTPLTCTELGILKVLLAHQDELISCESLIEQLRGSGCSCTLGMLYSHVSRLRAKLGEASRHLVTVQRQGYRLVI